MNAVDLVLLLVIAAALFFALRHMLRKKKSGCCGSCEGCALSGSCAGTSGRSDTKRDTEKTEVRA